MLRLWFVTLAAFVVLLLAGLFALVRYSEAQVDLASAAQDTILARVARGAPLAPTYRLTIAPRAEAVGLSVARFTRALQAGPYRYPSVATITLTTDSAEHWPDGWLRPTAGGTILTADGAVFTLRTRRRGPGWELAVGPPDANERNVWNHTDTAR